MRRETPEEQKVEPHHEIQIDHEKDVDLQIKNEEEKVEVLEEQKELIEIESLRGFEESPKVHDNEEEKLMEEENDLFKEEEKEPE